MYGIGIDTTTISRIEKSMQKQSFMQHCFSAMEIEYFNNHGNKPQSVAAAFAAKEALGKALGVGITGYKLYEAAVMHKENGAPYFAFSGELLSLIEKLHLTAYLSLTHEGGFATAFVVLE